MDLFNNPQVATVVILVVAISALALLLIVPRKLARRSPMMPPAVNPREQERQLDDAVAQVLVKLHDAGQELHAKVDTKMATLNRLIEEADQKIAALQAMHDSRPAPNQQAKSQPPAPLPRNPQHEKVYQLADTGNDSVSIARETGLGRGVVELILQLREK